MSTHDRYLSDNLFELGFASMERGDYKEGLDTIRAAAGADQFEWDPDKHYEPAVGIEHLSEIKRAADGFLDEKGKYSPFGDPKPHASALVFMGAHEEYRGFIERRTGKSPDYRVQGFINHLGHAIALYRRAEALGYPVASWRIEALKVKMGSADFQAAEESHDAYVGRAKAYQTDLANQVMTNLGSEARFDAPNQEEEEKKKKKSSGPPKAKNQPDRGQSLQDLLEYLNRERPEVSTPHLHDSPRKRKLALGLFVALGALVLVYIVSSSPGPQPREKTAPATVVENPGDRIAIPMKPVVPKGWQVVKRDKYSYAIPADWVVSSSLAAKLPDQSFADATEPADESATSVSTGLTGPLEMSPTQVIEIVRTRLEKAGAKSIETVRIVDANGTKTGEIPYFTYKCPSASSKGGHTDCYLQWLNLYGSDERSERRFLVVFLSSRDPNVDSGLFNQIVASVESR